MFEVSFTVTGLGSEGTRVFTTKGFKTHAEAEREGKRLAKEPGVVSVRVYQIPKHRPITIPTPGGATIQYEPEQIKQVASFLKGTPPPEPVYETGMSNEAYSALMARRRKG